jgi:predicted esterase
MAQVPATTPMLMISGTKDELVPPSQMVQLKELREAQKGKLRWKTVEGGHNDTFMAKGYWEEVALWLREEFP